MCQRITPMASHTTLKDQFNATHNYALSSSSHLMLHVEIHEDHYNQRDTMILIQHYIKCLV